MSKDFFQHRQQFIYKVVLVRREIGSRTKEAALIDLEAYDFESSIQNLKKKNCNQGKRETVYFTYLETTRFVTKAVDLASP